MINYLYKNHIGVRKEYSLSSIVGLIALLWLFLCLLMMLEYPVEIFLWGCIVFMGVDFLHRMNNKSQCSDTSIVFIYFFATLCFGVFTIITHVSIISNPDQDVFLTIDSGTFNQVGQDVASNKWDEFIPFITSQILYSDFYLFSYLLGVLYKLTDLLGGTSPILLCKLLGTTIGALTVALTYLCVTVVKGTQPPILSFIWFILFSPLIENASVLMRDIYICFFYIWIFYYVLEENSKKRVLKIFLLLLLCTLVRPENGIFALAFLFLVWYESIRGWSGGKKVIIYSILIFLILGALAIIIPIIEQVLINYQIKDLAAASSSSFGVVLKSLPFPLNVFVPAIFSQIMPFPFWFNIGRPYGGEWTILSIFSSFYWIAIWSVIIWILIKKWTDLWHNNRIVLMSLGVAIIYICMTAYGEVNVRRIMGVYPIIFVFYCAYKPLIQYRNRIKLQRFSTITLILLNCIYFIIK